jgi:hypothetical protein
MMTNKQLTEDSVEGGFSRGTPHFMSAAFTTNSHIYGGAFTTMDKGAGGSIHGY